MMCTSNPGVKGKGKPDLEKQTGMVKRREMCGCLGLILTTGGVVTETMQQRKLQIQGQDCG